MVLVVVLVVLVVLVVVVLVLVLVLVVVVGLVAVVVRKVVVEVCGGARLTPKSRRGGGRGGCSGRPRGGSLP